MSDRNRDESLFADSTMSFGEHIEELRGALARALVGLAIGIGIAFYVAGDAVQWIEKPLKDGLIQFNVAKATSESGEDLTPEQLGMITESRMVPTEIHIEADALWSQLQAAYPLRFPTSSYQPHIFQPSDIADNLPSICERLIRNHKADSLPSLAVAGLNDEQRATLTKIASSESPSDQEAQSVADILNEIVRRPDVALGTTSAMIQQVFKSIDQRRAIARLVDRVKADGALADGALAPRVNRLLLDAAFAPDLPYEKPKIVRVVAWRPVASSIQTLRAEEAFMTWFKAAFVVGALLSAPWVFYQLWNFVAAGLYPHEKNYVHTFLPFSLSLFFAGAGLAFFFVFPYVLKFLFSFNQMIGADINPRLNDWLGFALFLPLGFGISFQLPLVMLLLERIGVVSNSVYLSNWRIAVLIIAVLSMLLTPADPSSMLLMGMPLTVLYFGGIGLCKWMPKRRSPVGEGYDP